MSRCHALALALIAVPPFVVSFTVGRAQDGILWDAPVAIDTGVTSLGGSLTWDPLHLPGSGLEITTDDSGEASVPLYGGGCSATGVSSISCLYDQELYLQGAKSPDINGDCVVGEDDLDYARSKLGTDDFCADLDMSGAVGPEDVAIVEATLWDHCSYVTTVPDGVRSMAPALVATPNPATAAVRLRLVGASAGAEAAAAADAGADARAEVSIHDASGRLVRRVPVEAGGASWDLRNTNGARVAAGIYFAESEIRGKRVTAPIVVF